MAFAALVLFLRYNKYQLQMDPKEGELSTVGVAAGDHSFAEIVDRIREHMVRE